MKDNKIILENNFIKLVLDEKTASIIPLINKSVNKDVISFKHDLLAYPIMERSLIKC